MDISLTFVNNSNSPSANVIIFQKNLASRAGQVAVAWWVFADSAPGSRYPFTYTPETEVSADDGFGNTTARIRSESGQLYRVHTAGLGYGISGAGPTVNRENIQVHNDMQMGNINVNLYRDGKLLAIKTGIAPQQKAVFEFEPMIWIGAISDIQAGEIINSAVLSEINTQISLVGIAKADIVMTGGGLGVDSRPFVFTLENVVSVPGAWAAELSETDHAAINAALLVQGIFYKPSEAISQDILQKAQAIFNESLELPEWQQDGNYMDAGMAAVMQYLKETYPWLTQEARYAVRHECMMYMK